MMTPQDNTTRYQPTPDNDAVPFPASPASATAASRARHQQDNSAQHRATTLWQANDTDRAPRSRADALPSLPQWPSRLQRRWHLTPDEALPVTTQTRVAQPTPGIPAILSPHALPTTPTPHAAQTDTLSLAAQMMAQESPITEQGPPATPTLPGSMALQAW